MAPKPKVEATANRSPGSKTKEASKKAAFDTVISSLQFTKFSNNKVKDGHSLTNQLAPKILIKPLPKKVTGTSKSKVGGHQRI